MPFACHANTTATDPVARLSNVSSSEAHGVNEKNQLILQSFANGDKMQFSYDGNGKLNYIHKLKNGSQWADPATLEHNERDRAALQGFKRKQAFDRFSEDAFSFTTFNRVFSPAIFQQIYYRDYYRIVKDTQTVEHILPEGGTLANEHTSLPARQLHSTSGYSYDSQNRLTDAVINTQYYQQDTNTRHQYAWNPDGSSASYDKDGTTATPQITRDASGLPVKVGNKTIEFDNDSKHYHPDLGKHVRENVKQLISLIPVNIPWISLPKP